MTDIELGVITLAIVFAAALCLLAMTWLVKRTLASGEDEEK